METIRYHDLKVYSDTSKKTYKIYRVGIEQMNALSAFLDDAGIDFEVVAYSVDKRNIATDFNAVRKASRHAHTNAKMIEAPVFDPVSNKMIFPPFSGDWMWIGNRYQMIKTVHRTDKEGKGEWFVTGDDDLDYCIIRRKVHPVITWEATACPNRSGHLVGECKTCNMVF